MRVRAVLLCLTLALGGCGLRPEPTAVTKTPETWQPASTPSPRKPVAVKTAEPTPEPTVEEKPQIATGTSKSMDAPSRGAFTYGPSRSNLPLELPGPAKSQVVSDSVLESLKGQAQYGGGAADWRQVAERALEVGDFSTAHEAFAKEAKIYRELGHVQAAIAEEIKAEQYGTELRFFRSVKAPKSKDNLARLEPENGCYVGAFIDRDGTLESHRFGSQTHGDIPQFNDLVGKKHRSFFMYRGYGHDFPRRWANYCKENGAIPHISWEPKDINAVADDEYLRSFIAAAKALDHPVVLRFACEMNGKWTPYNGDPEAYKRAFRIVYNASRKAPKVALLWCPNTVPRSNVEDYYPGDEYVDWVGVNFYSVPFLDNNPERPGDKIHPTDQLDFIYQKYAARKPIAIGEWAASQESSLTDRNLQGFSVAKLGQLYATLPTKYPRVKMVNWYDCNNIVRAREERQLNNFQITNSEFLLEAYRRAVSHPYYLGAGEQSSKRAYAAVKGNLKLSRGDELKISLKSYDPQLRVYFLVGDKVIHASDDPLEWFVTTSQLRQFKKGKVKVVVFDSKNRFVTSKGLKFQIS